MKKNIDGQLSIFDTPQATRRCVAGCDDCVCNSCLMWWSGRCPYGGCYDDHRADVHPYDKAHPNDPPRKSWTNWKQDQAFWCRGGIFYPSFYCEHYIKYQGSIVSDCLGAAVQRFQDGYMRCGLGAVLDCESCYKRFMQNLDE